MTEQPFKDGEVLWRWTPTDEQRKSWEPALGHEYVFAKITVEGDLFRYATFAKDYDGWRRGEGEIAMLDHLLRELTEARQRNEQLESLCIEAVNELTKTLPANHPLRMKLERAGDGKEIPAQPGEPSDD